MKDTMTLKDGTVIDLETGGSLGALQVAAADRAAMLVTWTKLTSENLAVVQIKNGDGTVVGNHSDLVLVSETSVVAADGTVLTAYCMRSKTGTEKRLDALETGQEVQDGAIEDSAAAISTLADTGKGDKA